MGTQAHSRQAGNDRRRFQRIQVDHPAVLLFQGSEFPNCRIKDYSAGGLYLECGNSAREIQSTLNAGDGESRHALIELAVDEGEQEEMSVPVQIVHASEHGLGVAFIGANLPLKKYLKEVSRRACQRSVAGSRQPATPQHSSELFEKIRKASLGFLEERLPDFFKQSQERLLAAADRVTDSSQAELFHAISILKNEQAAIKSVLNDELTAKFDSMQNGCRSPEKVPYPADDLELGLIDKRDFEEWLVIVGFARSVEASVPSHLHSLERALTYLTLNPVNGDNNPVAPASLLWGLSSALQQLGIEFQTRKLIYAVYLATFLIQIRRLYEELNTLFRTFGLVADDQVSRRVIRQSAPPTDAAEAKPVRRAGGHSVLDTLTSISALQERERDVNGEGKSNAARTISRDQIMQSLASLPPATRQTVRQRLEENLGAGENGEEGLELDRETRSTIDTTEQLVGALSQDSRVGEELKQLITWLELPLINEALTEPNLLNDKTHPVRELLESIDQLTPYTDPHKPDEETRLSLQRIVQRFKDIPPGASRKQILEVKNEVDRLLGKKKETFEKNREFVVDSRKQRDRFEQIRSLVTELLRKKLEGKSVSVTVDRLLRLGWPGLLIHSAVANGISSRKTEGYLSVIDFLTKAFDSEEPHAGINQSSVSRLCLMLRKGFTEYPVHGKQAQELIRELEHALLEGGDAYRSLARDRVLIDEDYFRQYLNAQTPAAGVTTNPSGNPTAKWIDLLNQISLGDWIVQQRAQGQVRLLNLAWKNQAATRFLFVDGKGNKALETDAETLAEAFGKQEYSLLENHELPLVERAVQRMLEGTFEKIKNESRTDALTGLMNRKAFEQEIEALLQSAILDGREHVLIVLDIDRFAMVNDLCGYEGGDELLRHITKIISSYQGAEATVARTGDDEFGILMMETTVDKGYQSAETQRRALKSFQFNWEQQSIPVSVSTGIVSVDSSGETASALLKAASSACALAKQAGRNCSRVYQWSKQDLQEQHRLIQSIPVIERALQKDRIELHAQLITPLFRGEERDHYEILLRVLDDDDKPGSPADFILSAERLDRMRSIDRWVLNAFFKWASQHSDIGRSHNYSINISGQSLMDEQFRTLLRKHLNSGAIPTEMLGFEITETALVRQIHQAKQFINEIRQQGCKFYLDDFGSGYASYSYLKELPVDLIKIDGVFVSDMLTEKSSYAMVKSITEIAHYMDKKVVAEYVESNEIIMSLRGLGVDFGQGYAIGRPIPLNATLAAGYQETAPLRTAAT